LAKMPRSDERAGVSTVSKEIEYGVALSGFCGTLTFTALVLLLSFPETWTKNFYGHSGDLYVDGIVLLLTIICSICVLTRYGYFLMVT